MDCLDANTVQDLMAGVLESAQRAAVLGHLDTCDDCRELLNVTARDTLRDSQPAGLAETMAASLEETDEALAATVAPDDLLATPVKRATTARPAQGRKFGRYVLLDRLGAGAMGVVWLAEDPELKRKLAVKLLKRPDAALTDRLVR